MNRSFTALIIILQSSLFKYLYQNKKNKVSILSYVHIYLIFWNIRFYILCGITDIACGKNKKKTQKQTPALALHTIILFVGLGNILLSPNFTSWHQQQLKPLWWECKCAVGSLQKEPSTPLCDTNIIMEQTYCCLWEHLESQKVLWELVSTVHNF